MLLLVNLLLVVAFGLGNIYRFPMLTSGVFISFLDISVALLYFLGLTINFRQTLQNIKHYHHYIKAAVLFSCIALIALLLNGREFGPQAQLVGFLYLVRWLLYSGLVIVLPKKLSLYPIGIPTVVIGLAQYIFIPDIRFIAQQNWDPHYYRVIGSLLDPGFTGVILVIFLAWLMSKKGHLNSLLWVISYISLALTYSRSSYLAYLAMIAIVALQRRSKIFFLKFVALGVVTVFLLPRPGGEGVKLERSSTILARIQNWSNTITIASHYPFLGTGFNTFRYAQEKYGTLTDSNWQDNHAGAGADSSLLFVLATTGILGASIYLYYLHALGKLSGMAIFIGPLLVHSFFLNSLFYPAILCLLAIALSNLRADTER